MEGRCRRKYFCQDRLGAMLMAAPLKTVTVDVGGDGDGHDDLSDEPSCVVWLRPQSLVSVRRSELMGVTGLGRLQAVV